MFDPEKFKFEAGAVYRVTFKNGLSGEYHGEALARGFHFDSREVETVERMEVSVPPAPEEKEPDFYFDN